MPFVSVLRCEQANFRAGAAAFANATDLFVRRLAESENRFLKIDLLASLVGSRGRRDVGESPLSEVWRGAAFRVRCWPGPSRNFPCCGSSASSQLSRCWFIIAVAMVKWSAGAPPSLSGFGFSFPSIAGA